MWWSDRRGALARLGVLAGALATLAACGFEPMYAPAGPATAAQGRVEVAVIDGRPGFLMRERLIERLGPAAAPTHRLEIDLGLQQEGVALAQDDVTTRFDIIGEAAWRLVPLDAGTAILSGAERAVTGYSAPAEATASTFAILSARRDAEERVAMLLADLIATRVATAAGDWAGP